MTPARKPVVRSVQFTPFQGLMACAEKLTRVIETRVGVPLWDGEDGVSGVAADILRGFGVPEKAIDMGTPERVISPRMVAERVGLLKRKRTRKRTRKWVR